jgi:hypothetical protein
MTRMLTWSGVTSARSVTTKGFGLESVGIGAELVKVSRSKMVRRLSLTFGPDREGKRRPQISSSVEIECCGQGGSTNARQEEAITCSDRVAVHLAGR